MERRWNKICPQMENRILDDLLLFASWIFLTQPSLLSPPIPSLQHFSQRKRERKKERARMSWFIPYHQIKPNDCVTPNLIISSSQKMCIKEKRETFPFLFLFYSLLDSLSVSLCLCHKNSWFED